MSGALIIGPGPGLGQAIARRFAREGLPIALIARKQSTVDAAAEAVAGVPVLPLTADSTDESSLQTAIDRATAEFGTPDALIYNAAIIQQDSPGDLSAQQHLDAWNVNVVGAITASARVAPAMAERGSGSIILTGGMPVPVAAYLSLSLGKAGIRALTRMLHERYGPHGVHAATVTVYGGIEPGGPFDPDDIAEHYWTLHKQRRGEWQLEIAHTGEH